MTIMDRPAVDAYVRGARKLDKSSLERERKPLLLNPADREIRARQDRLVDGSLEFRADLVGNEHRETVFADLEDLRTDIATDGVAGAGDAIEFKAHDTSLTRPHLDLLTTNG